MSWWLDNTAQGRRVQRRILPESALMPRARAEAHEEREAQERETRERLYGRRTNVERRFPSPLESDPY